MTLKPTQPPKQWVSGRRFPQWNGRVLKLSNNLWLVRRLKMRGVVLSLAHTPHDTNGDAFSFTIFPLRPSQVLSVFVMEKRSLSRSKEDCVRNEKMLCECWKTWGWLDRTSRNMSPSTLWIYRVRINYRRRWGSHFLPALVYAFPVRWQ
jgi:hypothetical protein